MPTSSGSEAFVSSAGKIQVRLNVALIFSARWSSFFLKRDIFVVLMLLTAPHLLFWLSGQWRRLLYTSGALFAMLMARHGCARTAAWRWSASSYSGYSVAGNTVVGPFKTRIIVASARVATVPPSDPSMARSRFGWLTRGLIIITWTDAKYAEEQFRLVCDLQRRRWCVVPAAAPATTPS